MRKKRTALVAIVIPLALAIVKGGIGFATMSISVLASALDSLMDVFSSSITAFAVSTSEKPADENHPFGHAKAEAIAGLVQAVLIMVSASFLVYQALRRIALGYSLKEEGLALGIMLVSVMFSVFLSASMKKAGRIFNSTAFEASALNFTSDIWTNSGVIIALGLEKWWHVKNADPIISILISLYIIISASRIGHSAISQLMDRTLPREFLDLIGDTIRTHRPMAKGYHNLRTRWVGGEKFIEFHLELENELSFREAHDLTEIIISEIRAKIPNSRLMVHSDPEECAGHAKRPPDII